MWLKAEASFVYFEGLPRQVALVGSGHRPWAGPQGRRATRADGGTGSEVSEGGGGEKAAGGGLPGCHIVSAGTSQW